MFIDKICMKSIILYFVIRLQEPCAKKFLHSAKDG